jgi:hypothetical protein
MFVGVKAPENRNCLWREPHWEQKELDMGPHIKGKEKTYQALTKSKLFSFSHF